MFDEDISVFYDADEFATIFTVVGSSPAVSFAAIGGAVDEQALDGYVTTTARQIQWPTAAATLSRGDQISAASGPLAGTWRVLRDGERVNDGAESTTYIGPA